MNKQIIQSPQNYDLGRDTFCVLVNYSTTIWEIAFQIQKVQE